MKKIMALALAVAMIMAIVPATLAAPAAVNTDRFNETASSVEGTHNMQAASKSNINEKYLKATDTLSANTKETFSNLVTLNVDEIEPELADVNGYWLPAAEYFTEIDDLYTDGHHAYCQRLTVAEGEGDSRTLSAYDKGETLWFNYDLNSSFTDGTFVNLPEKEDGYSIECIAMAGELQADGNTINFSAAGSYTTLEAGISIKMTAPADDTYYMFLIIVDEVKTLKLSDFGSWLVISSTEKDSDFSTVTKGADMKVGEKVSTNVGSSETKMVVAPIQSTQYALSYAQAHKIQLEGGKKYVADFSSADEIGARVWFCDENMDVICDTFMPAEALGEYEYSDMAMAVWPTETGTYYMVVGGYWMTDEGTVDLEVVDWDAYGAPEIVDVNATINLDDLNETDYTAEDNSWGYHWYSKDKVGTLIIALPGVYTLKGDASDTFVQVFDGVKLIYDNATTAAVMLKNTMAPVSIESKNKATIADNAIWGYSIFNANSLASGGLYLMGEEITIEGVFGIVVENAPVHLCAKKLTVDTTSMEGYYPISIWVAGINNKKLSVGGNAKFDSSNKVCKLFYDGDGNYLYGYGVSAYDELYRAEGASPNWSEAALRFELTTDGKIGGGSNAAKLGDANNDGKVNTGDATAVLRHAASILALEGVGLANADVNQDGKVNTGDATMILKIAAGIIPQP